MTRNQGRIDVHLHSMSPAYREAIRSLAAHIRTPDWSPELAVAFLDRHNIGAGILSLSVPGSHLGDDADARVLAKRINRESAEYVTQRPDRFGALATLPIPDIEGACEAARHALDDLKLDGVGLLASYGGRYIGNPEWDPLLAVLNERSAVCFIHPNNHPSVDVVRQGITEGLGNFVAEFVFDTTRAALNILFRDVLDRFPNIRWVLAHSGGTLPYFSWRVAEIASRQMNVAPWDTQYPSAFMTRYEGQVTPQLILDMYKRFWYETALSAGPQTLGSLLNVADPTHILFGSDWPYCPDDMTEDMIAALAGNSELDAKQLQAIEGDNARLLFPRFMAAAG